MTRILDSINEVVEQAVARKVLGEDVYFDTSLTLIGGPDGNPQGMIVLAMQIRAVAIGQRHSGVAMLPLGVPDAAFEQAAEQMLDALLERRSQEMSISG